MGYLVLTRHQGDQIRLTIDPGVDTEKLLKHLLRDGITLHVGKVEGGRVSLGIDAPRQVLVLREELIGSYDTRDGLKDYPVLNSKSTSEQLQRRD